MSSHSFTTCDECGARTDQRTLGWGTVEVRIETPLFEKEKTRSYWRRDLCPKCVQSHVATAAQIEARKRNTTVSP